MSLHQACHFFDLPLEIRQRIYHFALPSQNTPPRSALWSTITNVPNNCMSLLLVNQQIFAEAREVLYGGNTFTFTFKISSLESYMLDDSQWLPDFRPFKSRVPIHYIKKWQLDLQFDRSYYQGRFIASPIRAPHLESFLDHDAYYIREGVLGMSVVMAEQSTDLQTLRIRVPCLCKKPETYQFGEVQSAVRKSLEPLTLLKFRGSVTLIAAQDKLIGNYWEIADSQCPEVVCLTFAESFADVKDVIGNQSVPPVLLTPRQKQWLDFKQQTAELFPEKKNMQRQIQLCLFNIWVAMETDTDADFEKKLNMTIQLINSRFEVKQGGV